MGRECAICKTGTTIGHHRKLLRGHYNVTGKRTFKPNLQKTEHEGKKVMACVSCIRTKAKHAK